MFPTTTSIDTPEALVARARAAGLAVQAPPGATFDDSGLDFLVVHAHDAAGTAWVVRTPRRPEVARAAETEARVLRFVAPRLPVAVPDWRVHTSDVIAYPRLGGTPAVTIGGNGTPEWHGVSPGVPLPATFVTSFAAALAALQSLDVDAAAAAGIPRKSIEEARVELGRAMDETRNDLHPSDALWARWHRWLEDEGAWPRDDERVLVHGDLHPGHMLLDEHTAALTGILDWTEAAIADPAIDLALYFGCFGAAALDDLLARLPRGGSRLARHAAERWAAAPALGAAWALRTGNDAVLAFTRGQLAALDAQMAG